MSDNQDESAVNNPLRLIPLSEIPGFLPLKNGKKIHLASIYRWTTKGLHGVRLKSVLLGGRQCTKFVWVEEFTERLAESRALSRYKK